MTNHCDDCRRPEALKRHSRVALNGAIISAWLCLPCGRRFDEITTRLNSAALLGA
jgi:hypothetical protein